MYWTEYHNVLNRIPQCTEQNTTMYWTEYHNVVQLCVTVTEGDCLFVCVWGVSILVCHVSVCWCICVCCVVRTCPLTGRGSCRAVAQTAGCGGSCEGPSWRYAVAEGDWTIASVLWPHVPKLENQWKKERTKQQLIKRVKLRVKTLKRGGSLLCNSSKSSQKYECAINTLLLVTGHRAKKLKRHKSWKPLFLTKQNLWNEYVNT
jgi:hypothetical protein